MLPMYVRNAEEHKRLFLDPKSAVSEAGLEMVNYEEIWSTYMHKYKELYEGRITKENSKGLR